MKQPFYQTIVIGGGPGGASAAIYLARFNHPVLLIDAAEEIPGRTRQALHLENVLGFTKETPGPEFLQNIGKQLKKFGVAQEKDRVAKVERTKDGVFTVKTEKGGTHKARFVIVAVGVHDVMPDVADISDYFGHSVFQCPTCNWYQTKEYQTGIIANDDAGITSALAFHVMKPGSCLFVVPDRPHPHFSDDMKEKAKKRGIAVHDSPLISFKGKNGKLSSIVLADGVELNVEILYTKLGVKRHDTFIDAGTLQVERNSEGYITVDFETLETSEPDLYAVGPCNTGPDQVMVAAGQGVSAAMSIHRKILEAEGV